MTTFQPAKHERCGYLTRIVAAVTSPGHLSKHALSVRSGEMVAIMGPSGCGKTTLLNCLSGLDEVDNGDVKIAGISLRGMSDNKKTTYRAHQMGFIFQVYNLLPVLSAVENVEMPLLVSGVRAGDARKRALEALALVGLPDRARHRSAELSGGERQRVTVARSLVNNPSIVWGDEPTGALDSQSAGDIMALLVQLNRQNAQTFVIVTHAPEVGALTHRIVRMNDGHITNDGTTPPTPIDQSLTATTHGDDTRIGGRYDESL